MPVNAHLMVNRGRPDYDGWIPPKAGRGSEAKLSPLATFPQCKPGPADSVCSISRLHGRSLRPLHQFEAA